MIGVCLVFCGILITILGIAQIKYANENKLPNTMTRLSLGIVDEKGERMTHSVSVPWGGGISVSDPYTSVGCIRAWIEPVAQERIEE